MIGFDIMQNIFLRCDIDTRIAIRKAFGWDFHDRRIIIKPELKHSGHCRLIFNDTYEWICGDKYRIILYKYNDKWFYNVFYLPMHLRRLGYIAEQANIFIGSMKMI
jgi:hypothetical protein